jgi:hypothetical protein
MAQPGYNDGKQRHAPGILAAGRVRGAHTAPRGAHAARRVGSVVHSQTPTHVSLADAARVVARQDQTILRWIAAGEFSKNEAMQLPARRGRSQAWRIELAALQRVNIAHGGFSWHPDAIREAAVPPNVAETLVRQVQEIRALKAELKLRRLLDT